MVLGFLTLLSLGQATLPIPTGVNEAVLGTSEQFAFQGPGKLCLRDASIELQPTETAYLSYSGIHSQTIEIRGPHGRLELSEGEDWARPRGRKRLILQRTDMKVYEIGNELEFRYLVYSRNENPDGEFEPKIWIDGDILQGDSSDRAIVRRLTFASAPDGECDVRYNYGWGVMLDGEPIFWRKDSDSQ